MFFSCIPRDGKLIFCLDSLDNQEDGLVDGEESDPSLDPEIEPLPSLPPLGIGSSRELTTEHGTAFLLCICMLRCADTRSYGSQALVG